MDSICRFIPAKSSGDLKTVHFVYETEFKKMSQPFIFPIYYMHLVTKGSGRMKLLEKVFELREGTLFFAFPGIPYEIEGSDDLTYMYISFMGLRANEIMHELKIEPQSAAIDGFEGEISFWKNAIQRINQKNANVLTESVLLYTLSYISGEGGEASFKSNNVVENIISYIDNNYMDPDLSLKKIADIFAYTDKYLSHIFKQNMNMNFTDYLSRLRIKRALEMIGEGEREMTALASACGYKDPVYFSKVFKKYTHKTPYEYIKSNKSKISDQTVFSGLSEDFE